LERNAAEVMNISVFSGVKFELIISRLVSRATVQRLYHYGPTKRMYCISPAWYTAPLNVCFPPFLFPDKRKETAENMGESRETQRATQEEWLGDVLRSLSSRSAFRGLLEGKLRSGAF